VCEELNIMANLKFIKATPGLNTTEMLLLLIKANPQGLTLKVLSNKINRPISMLNICLKSLIKNKQVEVKLNGMQRVFLPKLA
jgi:hypothetical protein